MRAIFELTNIIEIKPKPPATKQMMWVIFLPTFDAIEGKNKANSMETPLYTKKQIPTKLAPSL